VPLRDGTISKFEFMTGFEKFRSGVVTKINATVERNAKTVTR